MVSFDRQSTAPVGYYTTWPFTIRAPRQILPIPTVLLEWECYSYIFTVNWKLECMTWRCILGCAWAIPNNFILLSLFLSEKVREPKIKIFPKLGVNVALISDFLCAYFHISFHLCFINFVSFSFFFLFACLSSIIAFNHPLMNSPCFTFTKFKF